MAFMIRTDDKPHLDALLKEDQKKAVEVIGTFVQLIEEAIENHWHELPQEFHRDLKFADLVKGILHGSLDLPELNPESYPALKEEVHPLSMLSPRRDYLNGGLRYIDWRNHFRLPADAQINQETIEAITRKLWRYAKIIDMEQLGKALINRQVKTFEGLGERNVQNLPFMPALRYQQRMFGDLHVGKFFDNVGFLDCGSWVQDSTECPACQRPEITKYGSYRLCLACNAGFKEEAL